MPIFVYRAKNLRGDELTGTYEADSIDSLKSMLSTKGYFLISADYTGKNFLLSDLFGRVNVKDIAVFSRQFSVILKAGITVVEAVSILREQSSKKNLKKCLLEFMRNFTRERCSL